MARPKKGKDRISREELDDRLEDCYDALYDRAIELCRTHDTQIVASTMMAQALRLYKTILTAEDYKDMVATVADTAEQIQPYRAGKLH